MAESFQVSNREIERVKRVLCGGRASLSDEKGGGEGKEGRKVVARKYPSPRVPFVVRACVRLDLQLTFLVEALVVLVEQREDDEFERRAATATFRRVDVATRLLR